MSNRNIIAKENAQQCDVCGEIRELRPYGPKGEVICEPCSRTFPKEVIEARMAHHLFGVPLPQELITENDV